MKSLDELIKLTSERDIQLSVMFGVVIGSPKNTVFVSNGDLKGVETLDENQNTILAYDVTVLGGTEKAVQRACFDIENYLTIRKM